MEFERKLSQLPTDFVARGQRRQSLAVRYDSSLMERSQQLAYKKTNPPTECQANLKSSSLDFEMVYFKDGLDIIWFVYKFSEWPAKLLEKQH